MAAEQVPVLQMPVMAVPAGWPLTVMDAPDASGIPTFATAVPPNRLSVRVPPPVAVALVMTETAGPAATTVPLVVIDALVGAIHVTVFIVGLAVTVPLTG